MSDPYLSVSGAIARLHELDVVANNLANSDTVGFKRDRSAFGVYLEARIDDIAGATTEGAAGRVFTGTEATGVDFSNGPVHQTGAPLDVAILGPGFFQVEADDGVEFTRAGHFVANAAGELSLPDGTRLLGGGSPITVGEGGASIRADGSVLDAAGEVLGSIDLVTFDDLRRLEKVGATRFRAPDDMPPQPVTDPRLAERSVEASNVRPMEDMVALIELQRAFDLTLRSLQDDDQATRSIIEEFSR